MRTQAKRNWQPAGKAWIQGERARRRAAIGRLSRFSRLGNAQKGAENTAAADKWEGSGGCQTKPASTTRVLYSGVFAQPRQNFGVLVQPERTLARPAVPVARHAYVERPALRAPATVCIAVARQLFTSLSLFLSFSSAAQPVGCSSCHELGMGSSLNQVSISERVSFRGATRVETEISTSTLAIV